MDKKKLGIPLVIALVVIALAVAIGSGVMNFQEKEYRPAAGPLENEDTKWLRETAKRLNGDASQLTTAERARADQITRGYTDLAFKQLAKEP